jgi:hypothetical protein
MSQTWASSVAILLVQVLPLLGIDNIVPDQLTTTIQTIVTIAAGLWIIIRGWNDGHFTLGGARKRP